MLSKKQKPVMLTPPGEQAERSQNPHRTGQKWLQGMNILMIIALIPLLVSCANLTQGDQGVITTLSEQEANPAQDEGDTRPNIVVFMIDDAGVSDFGPFGGEAQTPAIDSLAEAGMKLTNFHVQVACSPTRSEILTGVDVHLNGMGVMLHNILNFPNLAQFGQEGYLGYLNDRVVTIATLLKDAGYHTYMLGKWHLGSEKEVRGQIVYEEGGWPIDRGFERSYGMLDGGGDNFGICDRPEGYCTRFFFDDKIYTPNLSGHYYSGRAHVARGIQFIDEGREADGDERKPFFMYYADTLSHGPNTVPDEYIKQEYIDMYYEMGWDGIRLERFERMKELGIIPTSIAFPPRDGGVPDWNDESDPNWEPLLKEVQEAPEVDENTPPIRVEQYQEMWGNIETVDQLKLTLATKYAAYIGMVEYFDYEVERIVTHLQEIGEYDNTVFMFFADNGADSSARDVSSAALWMARLAVDNSQENIGRRGSWVYNGRAWAQVSSGPFFAAKATVAEGGIRSPLVVAYPGGDIPAGTTSDALTTVRDLAATVLDYAGVEHPSGIGAEPNWDSCTGTYGDRTGICPINGHSMRGIFIQSEESIHMNKPLAYELFGTVNKALFLEEEDVTWKIMTLRHHGYSTGPTHPWKLFNLTEDPTELVDLSAENPEKFQEMLAMYNEYERNVNYIEKAGQINREAATGSTVPYTFELTNNSESATTFDVTCHSAWACSIGEEDAMQIAVTIEGGETAEIELSVAVPAGVADGYSNITQVQAYGTDGPQWSTNFTAVTTVSNP